MFFSKDIIEFDRIHDNTEVQIHTPTYTIQYFKSS